MKKNSLSFKQIFHLVILVCFAAFLFWISNPNILFNEGLSFFAFFIYLPVLIAVRKSPLKLVWLFGGLYGALSYGFYGYWLKSFHPLWLIIACIGYFLICALLFLVLKYADLIAKKNGWIIQFFCICAYEYLKTLGFFGISYGVTAYTQWKNIYLIQICDIIGVFGLNLLVIFPSAFLFSLITKKRAKNKLLNEADSEKHSHISAYVKKERALSKTSLGFTYTLGVFWFLCVCASYIYGFSDIQKKQDSTFVTVAAIQNNEDPWKNGIEEYSNNVRNLIQLTEEAQSLSTEIDFVVWPETAVTPSIVYNYDYGTDLRRYMLVSQLLNFIDENNAVFVIGNSHEVDVHGAERARYNSALVFEPGKNVHPPQPEIYSKIKLVPFTEYFPAKYIFPWLYIKLLNGDMNMWEKGDEYTVFDYRGLKFSTPICFEDTFDTICRLMVLNGSRCFINLSNDSWSKSVPCQMQHLAMAVFRCVENEVPGVRSTASGVTCSISPDGVIQKAASPFCSSFIISKVPVLKGDSKTIFTTYGDIAAYLELAIAGLLLIIQTIIVIIIKIKTN